MTGIGKWRLLASRYVHKDGWIALRADTCLTPEGAEISPYYVLEYPDWVQIVPFDADGNVLLVRQYRHAAGEITLELPAGKMDPDDAGPVATAARELLEETGCAGETLKLVNSCSPNPAIQTNRVHTVLVTGVKRVQPPKDDPGERIEALWLPAREALRRARSGELVTSMHVASLALAMLDLGMLTLDAG